MKIGILGAGAIGGYFGGKLKAAGHDVAFVARGETLKVLGETGVTLIDAHSEPTTTEVIQVPARNPLLRSKSFWVAWMWRLLPPRPCRVMRLLAAQRTVRPCRGSRW